MGGIGLMELLGIMLIGAVIAGMIAKAKGAPNVITWTLLGACFPLFGIIGAALFAKPAAPQPGAVAQPQPGWGQPQNGVQPPPGWGQSQPGWGPPQGDPGAPAPHPPAWSPAVAGATEFCPRCGVARTGVLRFCRGCAFDFEASPTA